MTTSMSTRPLGLAVVATPLLWLAAEAVSPTLKTSSAAQLTVIAAHPHRWYAYTVLLIAGTITLVPAAVGVARLTATRSPRLSAIGAALIGFSGIVAVGDAATQFVTWQMVHAGADRTQMVALLNRYDNSAAASIFYLPGGLALLIGAAVLAAALWRADLTPRWVGVSLGLGLAVNLLGFMSSSIPVITVGAAVMTPPCLLLGRRLLARTTAPVPVLAEPGTPVTV